MDAKSPPCAKASPAPSPSSISDLPPELLPFITSHLSTRCALALAATSRHHHDAITDAIYTRHMRTEPLGETPLWWACNRAVGTTTPAGGPISRVSRAAADTERYALATAGRALRLGADPGAHVPRHTALWVYQHDTPLLVAVMNRSVGMVRLLMEYGADPCAPGPRHTAVTLAASKGDLDVLVTLLGPPAVREADVGSSGTVAKSKVWPRVPNSRRLDGLAALHMAAGAGHDSCVRLLLSRGARVDMRDDEGGTALHHAVRGAKLTTVEVLVDEFHADTLAVDRDDNNALDVAVYQADCAAGSGSGGSWERKARLDILRWLLARHTVLPPRHSGLGEGRPRLVLPDDRAHRLLVPAGRQSPDTEIFEALVAAGINADARSSSSDDVRVTALWCLAGTPPPPRDIGPPGIDVAELLLDAGADIEARDSPSSSSSRDSSGMTPLLRAAEAGRSDWLALLLSRGADVTARDHRGRSVLQLAAGADHESGPTTALLLGHQTRREGSLSEAMAAQLDAADDEGWTPLLASIDKVIQTGNDYLSTNRFELMLLLRAGADPGRRTDCVFSTPLCMDVVDMVRDHNGNDDSVVTKNTPLAEVVRRGHVDMAKVLLKAGARVSVALECDPDLLESCRQGGDTKMLDLLEGRTPIDEEDADEAAAAGEGSAGEEERGGGGNDISVAVEVVEEDETDSVGSWDIERDGDPSTWVL